MSYKKRERNIYDSNSEKPFRLSRSRIESFLNCPRCFYLDRKLGVDRPGMPSFSLNDAVDHLFKKEFDLLRENGDAHDLMKEYGLDLIPFKHPDLASWRDDYHRYIGACVLHKATNLEICGIIDDIWQDKEGVLYIVDYKATSTAKEISLEDKYKQSYKRQVEVYQWIFRQMGYTVSDKAYFVFANASKEEPKFDKKLIFDITIIEHMGDDSWVEKAISDIHKCLLSDMMPKSAEDCEFCNYREAAKSVKS